jgi:hypothetical protein
MLTRKKNVFLLIPIILAFLPFARAEQLPRTPDLLPRCLVEAKVSVKRSDKPTTVTYNVTSCYWGNDAFAVKIARDDFALVGYESPASKTKKYWLRGWDNYLLVDNLLSDEGTNLFREAFVVAHMGIPYLCLNRYRMAIEDDGSEHAGSDGLHTVTYFPWNHQRVDENKEIYTRHLRAGLIEERVKFLPPSIPRSWDVWTTITRINGHIVDASYGFNVSKYEDFDSFRVVPARAYSQRITGIDKDTTITIEVTSLALSVRPFSRHDTPDKILGTLIRGLTPIRDPYEPKPTWDAVRSKFTRFFGFRIHHLVIGLAVAVLAWAAIRKYRLI